MGGSIKDMHSQEREPMVFDWSLYTDLYQLTMAQGYWMGSEKDRQATFTMYFRDYPFEGGYAIACGMTQLAEIIDGYSFSASDIEYLAGLDAPQGGKLFNAGFLDYLAGMQLSLDIDAVLEGSVVFPYEPIVRVQGPILQCQLVETALLNCINFETLIATKAARVCMAAQGRPVTEFGLRRAQGQGGLWASRAAVVGGCVATSNVLAGKLYDIPVSGTHSHSWVMSFGDELEAFREYARISPGNCSLLIDTYDVETGVENAITVAREMRERGGRVSAVRIDSGDLTWLAKQARAKLDAAGFSDIKIMLTNDLDEHTISSILQEGAPVDIWGVGTKLATAYDQPTLGGIYKLSAVRNSGDDKWSSRIKVSESVSKTTIPGVLDIRRYYTAEGTIAGDMVYDVNMDRDKDEIIVDPLDPLRRKQLSGLPYKDLLVPLVENGSSTDNAKMSAMQAQKRASDELKTLDETQLRILNPHTYPVGFERPLFEERNDLISRMRHIER